MAQQKMKMPPIEQLRGRQLGRILIKMGCIRRADVQEALEVQKQNRGPLGAILVELGHITEEELNLALAAQVGMDSVELGTMEIPAEVINLIPAQMANTYKIVPYDYDAGGHRLSVALASPDNFQATDDLQTLMGFGITAAICTADDLQKALGRYYPEGEQESISSLIDEIQDDDTLVRFDGRGDSIDLDELKELADSNPVKKLLNLVLLQAIRDNPEPANRLS